MARPDGHYDCRAAPARSGRVCRGVPLRLRGGRVSNARPLEIKNSAAIGTRRSARTARTSSSVRLGSSHGSTRPRGLAGARIDRISERARTNKRMIYAYFGDKDGLFDAVLKRQIGRLAWALVPQAQVVVIPGELAVTTSSMARLSTPCSARELGCGRSPAGWALASRPTGCGTPARTPATSAPSRVRRDGRAHFGSARRRGLVMIQRTMRADPMPVGESMRQPPARVRLVDVHDRLSVCPSWIVGDRNVQQGHGSRTEMRPSRAPCAALVRLAIRGRN
ncbi:TetR/AcrR family transcriptional regulator [Streptomyces sp. NPDC001978]|uniref:TetR/AcrR family transcriptional regulator n=1 Tax=Streptomyces sp. NPDC001978 TaxID=3364627 RepID=UPI0036A1AC8E